MQAIRALGVLAAGLSLTACSFEVRSGEADLDEMASGQYSITGPQMSGDCDELGDLELDFDLDARDRRLVRLENDVPEEVNQYTFDYEFELQAIDGIAELDIFATEAAVYDDGVEIEVDYDLALEVENDVVTGDAAVGVFVDGSQFCSGNYNLGGSRLAR